MKEMRVKHGVIQHSKMTTIQIMLAEFKAYSPPENLFLRNIECVNWSQQKC